MSSTPVAASESARPERGPRLPIGLAPLESADYRYLFAGTALTMAGYFMQVVAQGWLVYELTGSPTWLGITSFAAGIPMLVFSLPAGVLIDRFDRRLVLIAAQAWLTVTVVLLAGLVFAGLVQAWHVALLAFLGGSVFVLIVPARMALLPRTVPRPRLGPAIALLSIGMNTGRVVGPSLTGLLIAAFGVATSFAVQAAGFLLATLCAAGISPQPATPRARDRSAGQDLLEGLRYIRHDPTVLALIVLQAIPAFVLMPYVQLLPIFARDILQAGPEGLGLLMTAAGVGAVAGSVGIVLLPVRRRGLLLFVSLGAFGLLLAAFAASSSLPLSVALVGLVGVAQAVYLATNNTLVQLAAPDALQGRVMSVYMMTWGLMPLGSLPQGILADRLGAPVVVAGAGLLGCLVVAVMAARSPALRRQ